MSSGNLYGNGLIPFKDDGANVDDIDCLNDETFGDLAVEDDWELDHQQFADLSLSATRFSDIAAKTDILNASTRSTSSKQFEEDLDFDRSADHLTKGVERLLLNSEFDQDEIDPAIVSLRKQAHPPPLTNLPPNSATRLPLTLDNIFGNDVVMGRPEDIFSKLTKTGLFGEPLLSKYSNNNLSQPQQSLPQQQFLNNNTTTTKLPSQKLDVQFEDEAIVTAVRNIPPELNMKRPQQLPPQLFKAEDLEKDLRSSSSLSMSTSNSNLSMNLEHHGNTGNLPTSKHILNELLSKQQKRPPQQPNSTENMLPSNGNRFMPPPPPGVPPPHIMMEMNPGYFAPNFIFPPRGMMAPPPNHPAHQHHHQQVRSGGPPGGAIFTPVQAAQMMSNFRMRGIPPHHMHPSLMHGNHHHPFANHPNMMASPHHHMPFVRIPPPAMMQQQMQMMGPGHLHPEHRKFIQSRLRYGGNGYHGNSPHRNMQHRNNRGGMGWMRPGDQDPFANLMTQKEKDWVIRIQMMALQSDRPEIDDYYYQNYIDRRLKEGGYSDGIDGPQRLITPTNPNTDGKKYVPVQFTNSLGKLTTSSVYNPRQIIELTEEEIPENEGPENRQNLSKRLVIYKTIEKVYDILIVVEEKLRGSKCDHLDQRGIPLFGPYVKEINGHVDELVELCLNCDFDLLSFDAHDDQVFQLMKIRKGRKLIKRILPYLTQEQRNFVLQSITAHIANMVKRDAKDKILVEMYTMLVDIIMNLQANDMLIIVSPLTCFALATALRDRVGASLIFKLVVCGSLLFGVTADDDDNKVQDCDMQSRWTKFVADVTEVVITIATQKTQRHNTAAIRLMHDDDVTQTMRILQARSTRDHELIEKSLMRVIAYK